jgi:hypothetical protein
MKRRQDEYDPSQYQTDHLREVVEKEQAQKEAMKRVEEMRKEKLEKMLVYDKMIKDTHKPKPSNKKHMEIEILK